MPQSYMEVLLDEFHLSLLSGHFSTKKVCFFYYLNIFCSPIYCFANELCLIVLSGGKINLLFSLNQVCFCKAQYMDYIPVIKIT